MSTGYRILHTSDWHLGNSLHERSRIDEYKKFLDWLKGTVIDQKVDALLVSGDVFDTGSPSNAVQELYFSFLTELNGTCCKNVVITAGNHDSPSTLNAASSVLELLNVRVVATPNKETHFENEVFALPSAKNPQIIVCAAPYLRDAALQASLESEKPTTNEEFVREGTRAHFEKLKKIALQKRETLGKNCPIVAMAHLYAAGASLSENAADTEYSVVGNLQNVNMDIFPSDFDYVALGHIHRAQKVAGENRIRYSGSPLPMGFDEANRGNAVLLVDFEEGKEPLVREIQVPTFRKLLTIRGDDLQDIRRKMELAAQKSPKAWVRVQFAGAGAVGDLRNVLLADFEKTDLELLKAEYVARIDGNSEFQEEERDLSDFSPSEVFALRLQDSDGANLPPELKKQVEEAFQEILKQLQEGKEE